MPAALDTIVEIYLSDGKDYLLLPVIPPKVAYNEGETLAGSADIVNLGTVDFPQGNDLEEIGWDSFFPARYDTYCSGPVDMSPLAWKDTILAWKDSRTPIRLIITKCDLNKLFYIKSFNWSYEGAEGDIYYSIGFREYIDPQPKQVPAGSTTITDPSKKTPAERTGVNKKVPTEYTVKQGDSLYSIAKKYGLQWRDIYAKNRSVIGPNAAKLKAGQVLKL
jgi:LysM repeat protein